MKKEIQENYLRLLFELENGKGVRNVDIARKLNVSKASVFEILRKLRKQDFIKFKKYGKIFLTRKGKIYGEKHFDRHFIIRDFVKKYLNLNHKEAINQADSLEHAFSDESFLKIKNLVRGIEILKPRYVG
ncbi:MAG: metal-dependent transcriptional regulator [Candidatus Pacearchaeota archaeon]|nr:metal-dependent transcriptional regulator [Candidatus Pacearchaeota archaeon]